MVQPIHIKLEFAEALNSKRELLKTEMNFLNIANSIRNYQEMREKECNLKTSLKTKLKSSGLKIRSFKLKMPRIAEKKEEKKTEKIIIETNDIESELREIKSRLAKLS